MKSYSVTVQMKATEQYFPLVLFRDWSISIGGGGPEHRGGGSLRFQPS